MKIAIYKMTYINEAGTELFVMRDRNFDVLETRLLDRLEARGLKDGDLCFYKNGRQISNAVIVARVRSPNGVEQ